MSILFSLNNNNNNNNDNNIYFKVSSAVDIGYRYMGVQNMTQYDLSTQKYTVP